MTNHTMPVLTDEYRQKLIADCKREIQSLIEDVNEYSGEHEDWLLSLQSEIQRQQIALDSLEAKPVHQFIVNNPDHDGYIEWADCNHDFYSNEPHDKRRILYTAPPVPALKPIELNKGALMISSYATDPMNEDPVLCLSKDGVITAIRAAGYEVKS